MSVDDSAISDQQEPVPDADSDVKKHELPGQNGNTSALVDSQTSAADNRGASNSQPGQPPPENGLTRDPQVGVTDADWHNPSTPVPAPKSQDELIEHLSEALSDMASDFAELPALEVPKNIVVNRPGIAEGASSQFQPAIPPQPAHPAPSQQIRSSLPPGSVSSQSNPQLILPITAVQPSPPSASQKAELPEQEKAKSDSTVDTGDHPILPPQPPVHQQYFVMEGVAPPATPQAESIQHERKIQSEAKQNDEPKDGLEIRRIIATQQGVAAAQPFSQPGAQAQAAPESQATIQNQAANQHQASDLSQTSNQNQRSSQPAASGKQNPNEGQHHIPGQQTPGAHEQRIQPVAPSRPSPNDPPRSVGTTSNNSVQLPPMFGGKPITSAKETEPASDIDQQKAHTDLQALPKSPVIKSGSDLRQPTIKDRIPPELEARLGDTESTAPRSALTGHNFQPRQADPRSTMSALKAMPAPTPPAPGQPVSPLGAALASSLPSNPPTGQHTVPAALRDSGPDSKQPSQSAQHPVSAEESQQASANPLGPAASRPLPSIDNSGMVRAGGQAPSQPSANPVGPTPTANQPANPLGPLPTANLNNEHSKPNSLYKLKSIKKS